MSNTGATDAQIEAAIRRLGADRQYPQSVIDDDVAERPHGPIMTVDAWASYLVPTDQRIVPATAVPTADELAAMRRVWAFAADRANEVTMTDCDAMLAYLDRQR